MRHEPIEDFEARRRGPVPHNRRDITNVRKGLLVAKRPAARDRFNSIVWRCDCDCGGHSFVTANNFVHDRVKSCGCAKQRRPMIPHVRCLQRHQSTYLADCLNADGSVSFICPECAKEAGDELVLVNLPRLLFKRLSELTDDEKKASGA
jgi:hypothetical protein